MTTRSTRSTKRTTVRAKTPQPNPVPAAAPKPPYARGNPLTHSVTFVDRSDTCWLVYVEPAPAEPALWPNAAVLPGRRLRFDSVDTSLVMAPFPAGAPFLQEQALQALLDNARPVGAAHRPAVAPPRPVRSAARSATPPSIPAAEPTRDQLSQVVDSTSGVSYRLSRFLQPAALLFMAIRDLIVPKGRG